MDLGRGIARWVADGNSVVLASFTVRHERQDSLADVWRALQTAQGRVVSGRRWQSDQSEFRIRGYHRTTECTLTWENGWHPHYHVLYFLEGPAPSEARLVALKSRLFGRWTDGLAVEGFDAGWEHGIDIRAMKLENVAAFDGDVERALAENPSLAEYLTKSGARSAAQLADGRRMALEAVAHTGKFSRGGFTPFGLLGAIAELVEARAVDAKLGIESSPKLLSAYCWLVARWREWEQFSQGRRQVTMSRSCASTGKLGLPELLGLKDADFDDVELAAEEPEDREVVAVLSSRDARSLSERGLSVEGVAATIELSGLKVAVALCWSLGVELRTDVASLGLWEHEQAAMYRELRRSRAG